MRLAAGVQNSSSIKFYSWPRSLATLTIQACTTKLYLKHCCSDVYIKEPFSRECGESLIEQIVTLKPVHGTLKKLSQIFQTGLLKHPSGVNRGSVTLRNWVTQQSQRLVISYCNKGIPKFF